MFVPYASTGRSSGVRAWSLLLSALLVADGAAPPRETPDVAASAGAVGDAPLDEVQVSAYLRRLNPDLSDGENARIASAVVKFSAKYRLDPALVLAVITQESTARPWVRSEKGALGLMQVMPYMMGSLPIAGNATSIETNIEAGCIILADNIRRLGEERGILAYFGGNDIRGVSYLEDVQAARARIRRQAAAS